MRSSRPLPGSSRSEKRAARCACCRWDRTAGSGPASTIWKPGFSRRRSTRAGNVPPERKPVREVVQEILDVVQLVGPRYEWRRAHTLETFADAHLQRDRAAVAND